MPSAPMRKRQGASRARANLVFFFGKSQPAITMCVCAGRFLLRSHLWRCKGKARRCRRYSVQRQHTAGTGWGISRSSLSRQVSYALGTGVRRPVYLHRARTVICSALVFCALPHRSSLDGHQIAARQERNALQPSSRLPRARIVPSISRVPEYVLMCSVF